MFRHIWLTHPLPPNITSYFRLPKYLVWVFWFESRSPRQACTLALLTPKFSPLRGSILLWYLISQITEISTTSYFDSIQEAWDWRVLSYFCIKNFPISHYEMSHFKFTKYLPWFFLFDFQSPRQADTILQLPQKNFSPAAHQFVIIRFFSYFWNI